MALTTKVPEEQLAEFFETFTKQFLQNGAAKAADVEILEPDWGDQVAAQGARLLGISYDRHADTLEFHFDSGDHRVYGPGEIWVREEDDGFISAIEITRADSSRQIVSLERVGLRRID